MQIDKNGPSSVVREMGGKMVKPAVEKYEYAGRVQGRHEIGRERIQRCRITLEHGINIRGNSSLQCWAFALFR